MAVERGVATQSAAVIHVLELVLGGDQAPVKGRCDVCESLAVKTIHRQIDAEASLGVVDERLAKGNPDVDDADALAVAHDRCHAENT